MLPKPDIYTHHAHIRLLDNSDAKALSDYYWRNRTHLQDSEPARTEPFYAYENMRNLLLAAEGAFYNGSQIKLGAFGHSDQQLLACIDFSEILNEPMYSCNLGYSIDAQQQGKGLMREFLPPCLEYIFHSLGLHRIQASYMVNNHRSGRLLRHLGFLQEGLAKDYVHINGQWQDHILMAKLNSD